MNESPVKRRFMAEKYKAAIYEHFCDPKNYSLSTGPVYGEEYKKLCNFLVEGYADLMTVDDARVLLIQSEASLTDRLFGGDLEGMPQTEYAKVVAQSAAETFSSYPRRYSCAMSIPQFFFGGLDGSEIEIAEDLRLILPNIDKCEAILIYYGEGFYIRGSKSPFATRLATLAKIFTFIVSKISTQPFDNYGAVSKFSVFSETGKLIGDIEPVEGLSYLLGGIRVSRYSLGQATFSEAVAQDAAPAEIKKYVLAVAPLIKSLRTREFSRIATAIEWYVDSIGVYNQTVALLEVCIGLEALLGEEADMSEMTKRLCDRLAFTLGKTPSERKRYHSDYLALLQLRGKLVHAKIFRLKKDDELVLENGRKMLKKMIDHEVEHICHDWTCIGLIGPV
ncbi:HEPN domain-containing protein [Duganella phyllosphaerae]|uniref:Uncharacterized protein n=1 Tax=Duganella phyllosphaerae TaxID=762836 RepID=A0A1E7W4T3_9BURK|nr:HEPN domain-containing protein [Duganella phyllosphaerae]OEZ90707.1 hypothetical protein DUPY_53140 [Duganella phyllosphaerae]